MTRRPWFSIFVGFFILVGLGLLYSRSAIHQPEEDFEILAAETDRQTGSATARPQEEMSAAPLKNERTRLQELIDRETENIGSLNRDIQAMQAQKSEQQTLWEIAYPAQIQTLNMEIQKLIDEQSRLNTTDGDARQESEAAFNQRSRALETEKTRMSQQLRDREVALQKTQQLISELSDRISDAVERDRALVTLREQETAQRRGIDDLRNQIQDQENQALILKRNMENDLIDRNSRIRSRYNELASQIEELRSREQVLRRQQDQVRLSQLSIDDEIRKNSLELQRRQTALQESQSRMAELARTTGSSTEAPTTSH
jgi:hypothetical protein